MLPTDYQTYIAKSRYARYLPSEKRRETWTETVDRYVNYFYEKHPDTFPKDEIRKSIIDLEVMPSMRSVMTAGKALDRDNAAGYNCAYLAIDDQRAFDECMYLLMCGTGVGFSVERQFISKLPIVSEEFYDTDSVIKVRDSKIGWATALKELTSMLYQGAIPKWDLSLVRAAGEPLKIFGGRSSGPQPLDDLFKFFVLTIKNARGRKLNSIECNDLMCKIGETVVVGGVRRSACICLTNLSDDRMRVAKSGQWWTSSPQRALANISVAYTEKPEVGQFMEEWLSLYNSKSGERGIFNRVAAVRKIKSIGRRNPEPIREAGGINPCVTGDMIVDIRLYGSICKKTVKEVVELYKENKDIQILSRDITNYLTDYFDISCAELTRKSAKIVKISDNKGNFIRVTEDHLIFTWNKGYIKAKDIEYLDTLFTLSGNTVFNTIEEDGYEDVYDFTVPETSNFFINGILVHNCGEIVLRNCQFCNLSEVIIRSEDTLEDILNKVRIATIIGTHQATLTNFRYLRSIWKKNTEEERLLGVSLTGIMDHEVFSGKNGDTMLEEWLTEMKEVAIETNKVLAEKLGINQSVAITTTKPSGTISQLCDTSSGIHPRYSEYYIRTVRSDNTDPLTKFMKDSGIPNEPDVTKPFHTTVFSFPIKSPENSVISTEIDAIEMLELDLLYNRYWTEHNVSITVYVREHEWFAVGAWVYDHFDEINGISFLPYSDHTYKQAPYQPITEEKYEEWVKKMPVVDWNNFNVEELQDNTIGSQTYACSGNSCEIL